MLLQLKVGCRWTKTFQSLLLIIFRLILWKCKSNDAIPLLKLLQLSTYFCKYLSHPTGAALASSQDPILSYSLPPWDCSARTFSYSMCVLSFEVIIFIGKPFLICPRTLYMRLQHWIEKKTHWNHVLLKVAKGKKQGENARQSGLLNICHFLPYMCSNRVFIRRTQPLSGALLELPSSGLSNSLTQSPWSYDYIKMTRKIESS